MQYDNTKYRTDYPMPFDEFIRACADADRKVELFQYVMAQFEIASTEGRILAIENIVPLYKAVRDINVETIRNHNAWVDFDNEQRRKAAKRRKAKRARAARLEAINEK